jgi:hypothetical protein
MSRGPRPLRSALRTEEESETPLAATVSIKRGLWPTPRELHEGSERPYSSYVQNQQTYWQATALLNLLSRAHPQGSFQQQTQQRPGLRREPDAQPLPPQFARKGIQLEESKPQGPGTEGIHHALVAIERPMQELVLTPLTAAAAA